MQAEVPCSRTCPGAPLATMAEDGPRERREPSPRPICGLSAPCSEQTLERQHRPRLLYLMPRTLPDSHSPDAAAHVLPSAHLLAQVKGSQTKWISGFQDKMFYHEPETILEVAHYFPMSPVSKRMSYTEQRMLLTATVASEHCYPSRKRCVRKTGL